MLDQHDTIHAVEADFDTIFSWDYERSRGSLVKLYEKAKTSQWNATTDLDWSIDVDPEKIGRELGGGGTMRFQALQDAEGSPVKHFGEKEWRQVSVEIQNSLLSQFMHGEQGALLCTARIVETVPWIDAKYYAATQVMDEARHVEVFARYLDEKLGSQYGINDNLKAILNDILADPRWDIAYLGMQIMVEGLALAAFGLLHQLTTEPLLKKLLRYVMSDEARHVAFGVLSLQEFYKELSDAEMRERQEFAFDVAKRLQRRFAHTEMWARMGVDPEAVYRTMDRVNPPAQQMFQRLLFSKIVPNCKKLGLIDASGGWLRERFTEIGVIEFEDLADTGEEYAELDEVARDRETAAQFARVADLDREVLNAAADRGSLAAYWAERQPDKLAIRSAAGDRTFAEVAANANRLVRALRARGVQAGDGLALLCSNRPEFAETVVAVRQAGLRLTTINWHLTADEAGYIVDDCDATAFVADARFAEAAAGAAKLAPRLKARCSIGGEIDGFETWERTLGEQAAGAIDDPTAGGLMLYTSGTTGRPKGVRKERGDPRADLDVGMQTQYDPDRHVHLLTGPLYHAAPLAFSWSAPAALGVPIVMMDGWSAEETLRLIEQHRITHTHMVPTMFHRLLSLPDAVKAKYDISSLIFILHGAAPCPVDVKKRLMEWLGPIVWEYYAATEGSGTLVSPHAWLRRPGTVGKVDPPDHVRILDADGADAERGEVGTVYLKAPAPTATGRFEYYKAPEKTAGAYTGEYFTLGDYGYVDADGYLFLTDRSAHLIISGGVNIYPAEVEAELIGHPAVGDVGVVGVPDDDWGEIVVAVVEPQPGVEPSPELASELVEWCRDRIAHYKCPRRVEFTEALPRHDNGKLYKHQLREQLRNQ